MGRLWSWWDELFFRAGDDLVRLERRWKPYRGGLFLASWVSMTLAAHFVGLLAGATHHFYSWAGAVVIGGFLSLLVVVVFRR
jgi:hypothetical protein